MSIYTHECKKKQELAQYQGRMAKHVGKRKFEEMRVMLVVDNMVPEPVPSLLHPLPISYLYLSQRYPVYENDQWWWIAEPLASSAPYQDPEAQFINPKAFIRPVLSM